MLRRLLLLTLVAAGCGDEEPQVAGSARLVLDIPNGKLDPAGYTSVEITIHDASGDTVHSAAIVDGRFELGDFDPRSAVSIEAVLRNDSGAAVGYGRTSSVGDLAAGHAITVQIRRPIVYLAGVNYDVPNPTTQTKVWFGLPGTYFDLSSGVELDGTTPVADKPVLMISAGPRLYALDHAVSSTNGALSGQATLRAVSTTDHALGPSLAMLMRGVVLDGAGSDDGGTLVIGTTEALYLVSVPPEGPAVVREAATGSFSRVAVVTGEDGSASAVAIQDRVDTTAMACAQAAKLWWIANLAGEVPGAKAVATAGFADVASDRGRAWYVDACKGELGEATAAGVRPVRADLGRPTALAVSNGQAWIGIERLTTAMQPATLALEVAQVEATSGTRRTLWIEPQEQILGATNYPGVERRLKGETAQFLALEVGAGGEYVAAATSGRFLGARVSPANFPQMVLETRELRVFDAGSGGIVQRYRTWCDGMFTVLSGNDIDDWSCDVQTGQNAPDDPLREHKLSSMTFLFGKK